MFIKGDSGVIEEIGGGFFHLSGWRGEEGSCGIMG